jgi:hypothetical protein
MSRLSKFNADNSLQLLLLLRGIHDLPHHQLNVMEINIIPTNVLDLPLNEIRMHQHILGQRLNIECLSDSQVF